MFHCIDLQILFEISFASVVPPTASCDGNDNGPIACHYLSDLRQVVVAFAGGDVVILETTMCGLGGVVNEEALDCVGSIDAGIVAMCWSPDEEVSQAVCRLL